MDPLGQTGVVERVATWRLEERTAGGVVGGITGGGGGGGGDIEGLHADDAVVSRRVVAADKGGG